MFTKEEIKRTTENWPVVKRSKMKKRPGLGQRRSKIASIKIKHLMKFEAVKAKHTLLYPKES